MGYYAEEGLQVTFIEGGTKVDKLAPVLNGTAQFGVASPDELIIARSNGNRLKAFSTIFRLNPVVFVSLKDKNITIPQQFIGKTIRASANTAPTLNAMMARLGISIDQYSYVDTPSDIEMFSSGEIPVWGIYRNAMLVAIQKAGYPVNIIYPDDYGVHFYSDSLYTTDEIINNDPQLVQRFLKASLKGWKFAVENPQRIPEFVQIYNPDADLQIERDRMIATIPMVNTGEDNIGWMTPEVWFEMEKTLRDQNLITAPVDVTQVFTMNFLEEIYK
jgi:NitT/TauT family transport system substrate-binding protein